ncbi:MAG: phosphoribosylanthranilate isomerase [Eubacterium sp.]|nr:phosphoribosylanthranilate isomerase [Eubacterium sp.]MDE6506123.1 phosphoribosylanthranilate isomerase [Eubacterium sp.]
MSKIKICGLKRLQDIDYVNALKPDFIGFILTSGFGRSITKETAKALKARLDKGIKAVGVFVNDDAEVINSFVADGIIDMVQLHGNESADFCKAINAPVIKVFKPEAFDKISEYEPFADYFLFDSGTGTGKTFDWCSIPKTEKPFFLAGGLFAGNLEKAINRVKPFAVDLSSSVETDGFKDFEKIKKVMEIVK